MLWLAKHNDSIKMKVLHSLAMGNTGGIEVLINNFSAYTRHESVYFFVWGGGVCADSLLSNEHNVVINKAYEEGKLSIFRKIFHYTRVENVQVIVQHHGAPMMRVFWCIHRFIRPNIKYLIYAHCNAEDMYIKNGKKSYIKYLIAKFSYMYCDKIIAISESVKISLIEHFSIDSNKISVIYNGVPISEFCSNNIIERNIKNFIFIGRLIKEKGVQIILQALSKLPNSLDFKFTIVGDGPYRNVLEKETIRLGIEKKVVFLGTRRDIRELLYQNGIFIHMPIWEEGFGITIVEAMATGAVCVCAKSGAIPEIIADNKDGFLITKGDSAALSKKLLYLLTEISNEELIRIREKAIDKAYEFCIEKYAEEVDKVIENIT